LIFVKILAFLRIKSGASSYSCSSRYSGLVLLIYGMLRVLMVSGLRFFFFSWFLWVYGCLFAGSCALVFQSLFHTVVLISCYTLDLTDGLIPLFTTRLMMILNEASKLILVQFIPIPKLFKHTVIICLYQWRACPFLLIYIILLVRINKLGLLLRRGLVLGLLVLL
jgi:hypothetical protein